MCPIAMTTLHLSLHMLRNFSTYSGKLKLARSKVSLVLSSFINTLCFAINPYMSLAINLYQRPNVAGIQPYTDAHPTSRPIRAIDEHQCEGNGSHLEK